MAEAKLTPSAQKYLAEIVRILEGERFSGEIRIEVHEGGIRRVLVTKAIEC